MISEHDKKFLELRQLKKELSNRSSGGIELEWYSNFSRTSFLVESGNYGLLEHSKLLKQEKMILIDIDDDYLIFEDNIKVDKDYYSMFSVVGGISPFDELVELAVEMTMRNKIYIDYLDINNIDVSGIHDEVFGILGLSSFRYDRESVLFLLNKLREVNLT